MGPASEPRRRRLAGCGKEGQRSAAGGRRCTPLPAGLHHRVLLPASLPGTPAGIRCCCSKPPLLWRAATRRSPAPVLLLLAASFHLTPVSGRSSACRLLSRLLPPLLLLAATAAAAEVQPSGHAAGRCMQQQQHSHCSHSHHHTLPGCRQHQCGPMQQHRSSAAPAASGRCRARGRAGCASSGAAGAEEQEGARGGGRVSARAGLWHAACTRAAAPTLAAVVCWPAGSAAIRLDAAGSSSDTEMNSVATA